MRSPSEATLTAWGRSHASVSRCWRVGDGAEAAAALRSSGPRGVIARGFARSYGDVCLNDGGDVIDTTSLDRIHALDAERGILSCDAGVSYASLMRYCVPRGWCPPVCPGTAVVSMGGAVANDVHGKNQEASGNFGDHIDWLDLLLPDGSTRRVTFDSDRGLFEATVGGVGLTGLILALQIRLTRIPSNAVELHERRVPDLDAFLDLVRSGAEEYPYVVGWIDALSRGRNLGRGVLELARPSPRGVREPLGLSVAIPFDFPEWALNPHSVRAFNAAYLRRVPAGGRTRTVHLNRFLYPLDALHHWNRMYGRSGVYQFQCVVPFRDGRRAILELMEELTREGGASFLAVLKAFGRRGRGLLSFPMPGFTLALDFPRRATTRKLIERLYDITLKYEGRIYLAKDACMTAEQMRPMYPRLEEFRSVLGRIDPRGVMQSDMSRRLELHGRERS